MNAVQFSGNNGSEIIDWAEPSAYVCNGSRLWMRLKKCGEVTLSRGDWLIQADDGWWHRRTNEAFIAEGLDPLTPTYQ